MKHDIEKRLHRLELKNRLLLLLIAAFVPVIFFVGTAIDENQTVRCNRLEVVDSNGGLLAVVGEDEDGSRGLFIYDKTKRLRVATLHDDSQSAFYAFDSTGTIRIGVAQFAHGGGGVALHGEESKGATVLYHKKRGHLSFYDTEGTVTERFPDKN